MLWLKKNIGGLVASYINGSSIKNHISSFRVCTRQKESLIATIISSLITVNVRNGNHTMVCLVTSTSTRSILFQQSFFYGLYMRFRRQIITNIPVAVHTSVILYIQGRGMITFMTGSNLLWAYFKIYNYNSFNSIVLQEEDETIL